MHGIRLQQPSIFALADTMPRARLRISVKKPEKRRDKLEIHSSRIFPQQFPQIFSHNQVLLFEFLFTTLTLIPKVRKGEETDKAGKETQCTNHRDWDTKKDGRGNDSTHSSEAVQRRMLQYRELAENIG